MNYKEFLANKRFVLESSGFDIDKAELNPMLYEFQKDVVRWALKKEKHVYLPIVDLENTDAVIMGISGT